MYATTANDVEDDTELDITLQPMAVEQRPEHPAVSRSFHCRDLDGTPLVLNEFEDAPLDADRIALGEWHAVERAVGDVFDGEASIGSGYDTSVQRVETPEAATVGPLPEVPGSITTAADIVDDEPLNITARVDDVRAFDDHDQIAARLDLTDVAGDRLQATIFVDDESVPATDWEPAQWYRFGSVLGDVFRGQPGFTPTAPTDAIPVSAPEMAREAPADRRANGGESEPPETSDCPECGAAVALRLSADDAREGGELTASDLDGGTFFACPACQIAWDYTDRRPHDYPLVSAGPGGALSEQSAGYGLRQQYTSTFRLLGYHDGNLMLRDVGEMPFANADGFASPKLLEEQLGPVIEVRGDGYPQSVQRTVNVLRTAYCVRATVGTTGPDERYEIDAEEPVELVEAVPVDYVLNADDAPSLADRVWRDARDELVPNGDQPRVRRAINRDGGPEGDVYVFARGLEVDGLPLLEAIRRGVTEHLEKFTTNFTGGFGGDVADVIFVVPSNRPYVAVYVLSEECLDLAHDLRSKYGLPPAHRGWTTNTAAATPVRYDPRYVEEGTVDGDPGLIATGEHRGSVTLATGESTGPDLTVTPRPHDLVVELDADGTRTEVARVRPPSARL